MATYQIKPGMRFGVAGLVWPATVELTDDEARGLLDLVEPAPQPVEPAPEWEMVEAEPEPVEPAPQQVEPAPQPVEPAPQPVEPAPAIKQGRAKKV